MTQALQSPYAVPVLQIVAAVAVLQIMNGANLSRFVADRLTEIKDECFDAARKMIYDSPVIAMWDPLESTCRHASLSIL